ncbi:YczE/YyaS/YitT family protein [Acutalibacter caecimuris]|uniref:YczE/YyaS/YitT family protein n=1 Tax=Acutalibacter caecimuris TaxID=3093657 RepID=UPI002AC8D8BD|nr:hypothetical protein [Acutalibacter sp. M00118]
MASFFLRFAGQHLPRRIAAMLLAVTMMGVGVGFFMLAAMGSDPFSTLNLGVSARLHLSFGTWQAIFNILLLAVVVLTDRSKLGLGTLGNMFLVGYAADITSALLRQVVDAASLGLPSRVAMTLLGVSMQLIGCAFYVTCGLGMAPYDCVSYIVPERTRIPFRWWRMGLDVVCVAVGFACGAAIGIGTLLMAFCTGPVLPLLNRYVAGPLLGAQAYRKSP